MAIRQRKRESRAAPVDPQRRRGIAMPLLAAMAVAAICLGAVVVFGHDEHTPATGRSASLVGIEWQLESITHEGKVRRYAADFDAVIRFDGKGNTSGYDGGNAFGAAVKINADTLRLGSLMVGGIGYMGDTSAAALVDAALPVVNLWSITQGKLRLSGEGYTMTFHVRASIFPYRGVTALNQGKRGTADYRFGYGNVEGELSLTWEWRSAPGSGWERSDWAETSPRDPQCGKAGRWEAFVFGWARDRSVVYQDASRQVSLATRRVGGSFAFGGFIPHPRSGSAVIVRAADGSDLARSTSLNCG